MLMKNSVNTGQLASLEARSRGSKTFFMFNSAENGILIVKHNSLRTSQIK